ncbi:MAG: sulfotransferase [Nitrospinae bacterium]|nr:sulfotransferase [Nitrospinota bacterium]
MTENTERPVFVVSSPRSGSTLLRLILDAHPNLAVPPPAWLTHFIYPYLFSYGDLSNEANLAEMIEDSLATPTIRAWPISPTQEEVRDEMQEPTFAEMYAALHRLYAKSEGKERWGEKTPRVCFYMEDLKSMYPGAVRPHHQGRPGRRHRHRRFRAVAEQPLRDRRRLARLRPDRERFGEKAGA